MAKRSIYKISFCNSYSFTKIKFDKLGTRINEKFIKAIKGDPAAIPGEKFFWFRMSGKYLYYTWDKKNMNVLGSILVSKIEKLENFNGKIF